MISALSRGRRYLALSALATLLASGLASCWSDQALSFGRGAGQAGDVEAGASSTAGEPDSVGGASGEAGNGDSGNAGRMASAGTRDAGGSGSILTAGSGGSHALGGSGGGAGTTSGGGAGYGGNASGGNGVAGVGGSSGTAATAGSGAGGSTAGGGGLSGADEGGSGGLGVAGDGQAAGASSGGESPGCPSAFCDSPGATENCGANCEPITRLECLACEPPICADTFCSQVPGQAQDGSAQGESRTALCNEVLSCLRRTGCSVNAGVADDVVASCYCGSTPFANCTAENAAGPCRSEFARGFESTAPEEISSRVFDADFGGGMADLRALCDVNNDCTNAGCFTTVP